MPASAKTPAAETSSHGSKPDDPASQASPAVAKALGIIAGVWIVAMAVVALVAGAGSDVFPDGWRLTLLQTASVVGFVAMAVAGVVAVIVLEGRRNGR